ncbi:DUF6876 family protein [Pedobacter sp. GR22-6]|uniref:DUF6876 family protein n=1 Tax=Pedobacter sp. GR22-6 TaxID=3127957 RepID=UPI00307F561A
MSTMRNVNEELSQFTGTSCYFKHPVFGFNYTEGIQYLAQEFKCYWLLKDIALHNHISLIRIDEPFQVWKLQRNNAPEHGFSLHCGDGNYNEVFRTTIPTSDFAGDEVTIWFIDEVLLLPSEY